MQATERTIVGTLQGAQRLMNSPSGNPRYRAFTLHGAYLTEPDAAVNHMITNHFGKLVRFTFNKEGRIIGIEPV